MLVPIFKEYVSPSLFVKSSDEAFHENSTGTFPSTVSSSDSIDTSLISGTEGRWLATNWEPAEETDVFFVTSFLGQEKAATIIGDIAPTYFVAISALVAAYFGANAYVDKKK